MKPAFDVLGLGAVAVDDLIYVDAFPPPDAKTSVLWTERHCGGLTATALVAAARLGSKCAYAGVLGTDEASDWAIGRMAAEGIDLTHLRRRAGAQTVHSFIVVDVNRNTRNVFANSNGAVGADADWPSDDVILSSGVVFVDHFGLPGMIRAARLARQRGVPVVADFERVSGPQFPELLSLVDHLILSQPFAQNVTGETDPAAAAQKLWDDDRAVVIVTCGDRGCWFVSKDHSAQPQRLQAFEVKTVDTTGCGDVFHGAYASALARGLALHDRLRFAAAAAALKATQRGGQAGIPSRSAVEEFLRLLGRH